ncbi:MAG: winged helix DNA-binding domain-containing protein [Actinomycetota bacterium]|nr:winged helix DNA-binding domain-containing protein [Actinomycetota bacterium]
MAGERVLSTQDLNRALLARQGLLEPFRSPLPKLLERVGGIQAQYAPSMYVGLWSRQVGFERRQLTSALERRTVVQGTLLRSTIHLVSAADWWAMAVGIRTSRRRWHLRTAKDGPDERSWQRIAATARRAFDGGPLHRRQLDELLGATGRAGVGLWLDLVRVPPSGTWEHRPADLFALAANWIGEPTVTEAEGVELLVRRYLGGFGPATPGEIANWAGIPVKLVNSALPRLELRRFRSEDGKALMDLPRAPLPDSATPAPVRFLPTWDATLLVHARRTQVLPEEYRPKIFHTKNPHSVNTFLVDGSVAGTWRLEGDRITIGEFAPLPTAVRRLVDDEAERLAAFQALGR